MARQYPDMNALQSAFDGDFQLLAVPSANFFNQEPSGDRDEIINALAHVRPGAGFKPNFPLFARSDVNGAGRLPVYSMALSRCPAPQANLADPHMLYYSPISQEDIRWNYEKILFDRNGQPYRRYSPTTEPFELEEDIRTLISQ